MRGSAFALVHKSVGLLNRALLWKNVSSRLSCYVSGGRFVQIGMCQPDLNWVSTLKNCTGPLFAICLLILKYMIRWPLRVLRGHFSNCFIFGGINRVLEGQKICAEVWQQIVFVGKTVTLIVNYKIMMEPLRYYLQRLSTVTQSDIRTLTLFSSTNPKSSHF